MTDLYVKAQMSWLNRNSLPLRPLPAGLVQTKDFIWSCTLMYILFLSCPVSPVFLTVSIGSNSLINHLHVNFMPGSASGNSNLTQLVLIKVWSIGWEPSFFIYLFFFCLFWPCHVVCGILVPQWGIEPVPSALEAQSLNHYTAREVLGTFLK